MADSKVNNTSSSLLNVVPYSTGVHYKALTVPDANYTISCIPTAIGNVIGYWDNNGYPALVGVASSGPYGGAHMTTGVGYYYEDTLPDKYVIVHDAWTSTPTDYYLKWDSSYNDFISKIVP